MPRAVKTGSTSAPRKRAAPVRGRPKDLGKRLAVLEAAQELFARDGLEGTSMEAIARLAGVSKVTLYSHFTDKDALFREAVTQVCHTHNPPQQYELLSGQPLIERFTLIAEGFFDLITSDAALALCRLMAGNHERHRKLSALFWQAGPEHSIALLSTLLRTATEAGELKVANPEEAAGQFFCLIKGPYHLQMLVGATDSIPADERRRHIDAAVKLFLAAYSPEQKAAKPV
jgi:TetR/AcrR family transcriptional repressor of mexJK operon